MKSLFILLLLPSTLLASIFNLQLKPAYQQYMIQTCQIFLLQKKYIYQKDDFIRFEKEGTNFKDNIYHIVRTSTEQTYYRYHSTQIYPIGRDYTWLSDRQFSSDQEIRNSLAILTSWNNLDYLSVFKIPAGTEMSVGIVGPQSCKDASVCGKAESFPGGGYQVLVNSLYLNKGMVNSTIKRQHQQN